MDFNFEARQIVIGAIVLLIVILGLGAWVIGRQASRLAKVVATPLTVSSPLPSPSPSPSVSPAPAVSTLPSPAVSTKPRSTFSTYVPITYQTVVTVSTPTPVAFAVTSVTSHNSPGAFSGSCPRTFTFYGTITVNRAGSVTYRWVRSDGSKGDEKTLNFAYASSLNAESESRDFGGSTSGWERIEVTSPNNIQSNQTSFSLSCN